MNGETKLTPQLIIWINDYIDVCRFVAIHMCTVYKIQNYRNVIVAANDGSYEFDSHVFYHTGSNVAILLYNSPT